MEILQTDDGFLWGAVTDKAVDMWELKLAPLFILHDDGSESLVETVSDIEQALSNGLQIAIELGYFQQKIRGKVDWDNVDKKIIDGFVYIKADDILFCE